MCHWIVHGLHGCLDVWFLLMDIQVYLQNTALWYADQVHKVGGFNAVAVKCPGSGDQGARCASLLRVLTHPSKPKDQRERATIAA